MHTIANVIAWILLSLPVWGVALWISAALIAPVGKVPNVEP